MSLGYECVQVYISREYLIESTDFSYGTSIISNSGLGRLLSADLKSVITYNSSSNILSI